MLDLLRTKKEEKISIVFAGGLNQLIHSQDENFFLAFEFKAKREVKKIFFSSLNPTTTTKKLILRHKIEILKGI